MGELLPADVMKEAEGLIVRGYTVSEAARLLRIADPGALYERIREDANLIRQRNTHFDIDVSLVKAKVLNTLTDLLDSQNDNSRLRAAQALMPYVMRKVDEGSGAVVVNFNMDPPRMPDPPQYIYETDGSVSDE